jgi:hypothetical protein
MTKPVRPKALDAALEFFRAWGAQGGKKGGKSRMANLTAEERSKLAKKAAEARWRKRKSR